MMTARFRLNLVTTSSWLKRLIAQHYLAYSLAPPVTSPRVLGILTPDLRPPKSSLTGALLPWWPSRARFTVTLFSGPLAGAVQPASFTPLAPTYNSACCWSDNTPSYMTSPESSIRYYVPAALRTGTGWNGTTGWTTAPTWTVAENRKKWIYIKEKFGEVNFFICILYWEHEIAYKEACFNS